MAKGKVALPKGFTSIGGFGESWRPTKKGASLQGVMKGSKTIKVERKRNGKTVKEPWTIYTIETNDGGEMQVGESSGLRALKSVKKGVEVFIRFDGMGKAKKGQNPPRLFTVATKTK